MRSSPQPRPAGPIRSDVFPVGRFQDLWIARTIVTVLALKRVLCPWLVPLGEFEWARDEEDAAIGEDDAEMREEEIDKVTNGGYDVLFGSRGESGRDAGVD